MDYSVKCTGVILILVILYKLIYDKNELFSDAIKNTVISYVDPYRFYESEEYKGGSTASSKYNVMLVGEQTPGHGINWLFKSMKVPPGMFGVLIKVNSSLTRREFFNTDREFPNLNRFFRKNKMLAFNSQDRLYWKYYIKIIDEVGLRIEKIRERTNRRSTLHNCSALYSTVGNNASTVHKNCSVELL
jgi:hypothetical protein